MLVLLFNFAIWPQTAITCKKFFWKWDILKEDYQKPQKVYFIFLLNPVSLNGQSYQKQKVSGTTGQLLFRLQSKFRKFCYLLYIIWPSLMMQYEAVFELFQKLHLQIYVNQFKASNYSTSICPSESVCKVWKGRDKITNIWISQELNELSRWNRRHFSKFLMDHHLVKK